MGCDLKALWVNSGYQHEQVYVEIRSRIQIHQRNWNLFLFQPPQVCSPPPLPPSSPTPVCRVLWSSLPTKSRRWRHSLQHTLVNSSRLLQSSECTFLILSHMVVSTAYCPLACAVL